MKKIMLLMVCLAVALVSCKPKVKVIEITGDAKNKVLAYSEAVTDGIMKGYNEMDHKTYSKDFDEKMKNALPEKVFNQKIKQIKDKIGEYKSRKVTKVQKQNQYTVVYYKTQFKDEKDVKMKVVFQKYGTKMLVSGHWLNSPKLRGEKKSKNKENKKDKKN